MHAFQNSSYDARRSPRCRHELFYPGVTTGNQLLPQAGWAFLSEKHAPLLNKAYVAYLSSHTSDIELVDMTKDEFPSELVSDLAQYNSKSIYASKIVGLTAVQETIATPSQRETT